MANVLTVDPADLPTGQEIEVALVPGNGFGRIRCTSGAGGTGVTSVTGTAPIVITGGPTTPNVTFDSTQSDLWPFDREIPASASPPELAQAQATIGGSGKTLTMRSQASATGSNANGADISLVLGASDGTAVGAAGGPFVWWGQEIVPGVPVTVFPPSNYFNYGVLKGHGGGVVAVVLGGGTNDGGSGIAGVELSAFAQFSIATELGGTPQSDIVIQPASTFGGGQAFFRHLTDPAIGTPGLSFGGFGDSGAQALTGILRLAYMQSATNQPILVQRDAGNANDLDIISRQTDRLTWGSFSESSVLLVRQSYTIEMGLQGGIGVSSFGPFGFVVAQGSDSAKTVSHGAVSGGNGSGGQRQLYSVVSSAVTPLNILAVTPGPGITPTVPGSVSHYRANVVAIDLTTHEWTSFSQEQAFSFFSGTVVASISTVTLDEVRESNAGLAAGTTPSFAVTSNTITLTVTPWSANNIEWVIELVVVVNGQASP